MINVSQTTKDLYLQGSVPKNITISIPNKNITITNEDIVSESMTLTETLNSSETIDFKGCIASVFKIKTVDIVQDILGEYMEVSITIQGGDTIPLFHGYIDDVSNLNHEDLTCEIVAYDRLYMLSQTDVLSWYNSLTFPITVKNFRDSLFTHLGIEQVAVTLPNDSRSLNKVYNESTMIALDVIKALCQINARLGRINREDKFEFVKVKPLTEGLYPADDLFPDDDLYPSEENTYIVLNKSDYKNIQYEPYRTEKITGVKVFKSDGTLASAFGDYDEQFSLYDNFLVDGITSYNDLARSIYNEIFQIQLIPATIELCAYPYIEIADGVMVNTRKNLVRTYIFKRTMTGIQALMDRWESECEQYQPEYRESVKTNINSNVTKIETVNTNLATNVETINTRIDTTNANLRTTNNNLANTNTSLQNNVTNLNNRIDTTNSNVNTVNNSLNSNVSRLDGRINSTNNDVSSVRGIVNTHSSQISGLNSGLSSTNTSLANLSRIAITTSNWTSQVVSNAMISSVDASKLTGTINLARIPNNLGDKSFSNVSCSSINASRASINECRVVKLNGHSLEFRNGYVRYNTG